MTWLHGYSTPPDQLSAEVRARIEATQAWADQQAPEPAAAFSPRLNDGALPSLPDADPLPPPATADSEN